VKFFGCRKAAFLIIKNILSNKTRLTNKNENDIFITVKKQGPKDGFFNQISVKTKKKAGVRARLSALKE